MHASDVVLAGLGAVAAVAGVTAAACAAGASRLKPSAPAGAPVDADGYRADDAAVERFRELIRIPTVSREDASLRDDEPFRQWVPTLRRLYPRTFEACELTTIDDFGILLRWPGADPAADPIVMMAHQDVVPVEGQDWEHDPFGAEVIDGQIWGRGTLDTKCIVGAFFEAAEAEQGGCRRRCRTVYIMMNQTLESARFGGLSRQNVR